MITKALLIAAAAGGLIVLPPMHKWTADLTPMPGHRISGSATFDGDTKNEVKVSLTLENATPNSSIAWHIHKGACSATDAPIIGKDSEYTPAQADGSGKVTTTVSLPINLNVGGYSVRVHAPAEAATPKTEVKTDSTMSRDTTPMRTDTTVARDTSAWKSKDATKKYEPTTPSSNPGKPELAACGDLRLQGGEKANR
jgi:hypothetical protein